MSFRPTLGADPEFFIRDRETGVPQPICGLLGGTKGAPIFRGVYGLQEDNVMCEYNIPPVEDYERFARHVINGRTAVLEALEEKFGKQYEADLVPARIFSHEQLAHPQAQVFGCSMDFDAYQLGQPNERIRPDALHEERGGWRFCGGHLHIGFRGGQKFDVPDYVAAQFGDVFVSLPLLSRDAQGMRRKFYGTAGRYRPTPYGIEYRTLSNRWTYTLHDCGLMAMHASAFGQFLTRPEADVRRAWSEIPWQDVKRAVEQEDVALASTLIGYVRGLGLEV